MHDVKSCISENSWFLKHSGEPLGWDLPYQCKPPASKMSHLSCVCAPSLVGADLRALLAEHTTFLRHMS